MYYSWLDHWDEARASRADSAKKRSAFILDAQRCFSEAKSVDSMEAFCAYAEAATADPQYFDVSGHASGIFERTGDWLRFTSSVTTDIDENNEVLVRITESGSTDKALIVVHHWNAIERNRRLATFFAKRGVTVAELTMPYHFERSRPGSSHADYMLSPNLGRTIQSVRQAVMDGRQVISWLKCNGYANISTLGMSLGSWVAGLIAANDTAVSKAALLLSAGSLSDMVWTGRATRHIRGSLDPVINLIELRRAWAPIDLENYAADLSRPDLDLQFILANRDTVVLTDLSHRFIERLEAAGASLRVLELNCGHYSLAQPPHVLWAGLRLRDFFL